MTTNTDSLLGYLLPKAAKSEPFTASIKLTIASSVRVTLSYNEKQQTTAINQNQIFNTNSTIITLYSNYSYTQKTYTTNERWVRVINYRARERDTTLVTIQMRETSLGENDKAQKHLSLHSAIINVGTTWFCTSILCFSSSN